MSVPLLAGQPLTGLQRLLIVADSATWRQRRVAVPGMALRARRADGDPASARKSANGSSCAPKRACPTTGIGSRDAELADHAGRVGTASARRALRELPHETNRVWLNGVLDMSS